MRPRTLWHAYLWPLFGSMLPFIVVAGGLLIAAIFIECSAQAAIAPTACANTYDPWMCEATAGDDAVLASRG